MAQEKQRETLKNKQKMPFFGRKTGSFFSHSEAKKGKKKKQQQQQQQQTNKQTNKQKK